MSPIGKYQTISFILVQIQTDFPSTDQETSLRSPIFPSTKLFQNNLHATAATRHWPPACTHAQHSTPASAGPACLCFNLQHYLSAMHYRFQFHAHQLTLDRTFPALLQRDSEVLFLVR
jgi:hypothetical protein